MRHCSLAFILMLPVMAYGQQTAASSTSAVVYQQAAYQDIAQEEVKNHGLVNHYISCAVLANLDSINEVDYGPSFIEKAITIKAENSTLTSLEIADNIEAVYLHKTDLFVGAVESETAIYWKVCKEEIS